MSVLFGIGAVGQQQTNAFGGRNSANTSQIGQPTIDWSEVEFEIAGVQDDALRRMERRCHAVRYRVSHRNELDIERTNHSTFAINNRNELGAIE